MNNKYGFYADLDREVLEAIIFLLAHDYAHCGIDEDGFSVYASVNDTFAYSTAESQEIPLDEIRALADEVLKHHTFNLYNNPGWFPILLWAQKKRDGMDFIPPVKKKVEEFLKGLEQ